MSDMEGMLIMYVNAAEWIKLKMFDEHQIAVCMYHPITEKNKLVVQAFQGVKEGLTCFGEIRVQSLTSTERKFRKKDRRIARWYFKELCKSLRDGIVIRENQRKRFRD